MRSKTVRPKAASARAARPKAAYPARPGTAAVKVPPSGPLTLDEAKALTRAALPGQSGPSRERRYARRRRKRPLPAPWAPNGKKLERAQRAEMKERIREYKATMALMKQRGARKPKAKAGPTAAAFAPLQVFAEGDSWFDYPVPFFGGGIIPRLQNRLGVPILNLANAGDEVRYMLGVEQRRPDRSS